MMTSERQQKQVTKMESISPVTLRMLRDLWYDSNPFLDGKLMDKFQIVGLVRQKQESEQAVQITLDDGTGTGQFLESAQFYDESNQFSQDEYISIVFDIAVRVSKDDSQNSPPEIFFNILQIDLVTDHNQIPFHIVQSILAQRRRQEKPIKTFEPKIYDPRANNSMKSVSSKNQPNSIDQ